MDGRDIGSNSSMKVDEVDHSENVMVQYLTLISGWWKWFNSNSNQICSIATFQKE